MIALQDCIALLHCVIALRYCFALLHCMTALQDCTAVLHCIVALHSSTALLHCIIALHSCIALLQCIIAMEFALHYCFARHCRLVCPPLRSENMINIIKFEEKCDYTRCHIRCYYTMLQRPPWSNPSLRFRENNKNK